MQVCIKKTELEHVLSELNGWLAVLNKEAEAGLESTSLPIEIGVVCAIQRQLHHLLNPTLH